MSRYPTLTGDEPCRVSPDSWFPEKGDWRTAQVAKKACKSCPIRDACAAYALAQPYTLQGIWGGLSVEDRERVRRGRPVVDCGTHAGWQRHRRAGEQPCRPCMDGHNTYKRERRGAAA